MNYVVRTDVQVNFFVHRYDDFISSDDVVLAILIHVVAELPPPLLTFNFDCSAVAFAT